jgi:hypothetical protein
MGFHSCQRTIKHGIMDDETESLLATVKTSLSQVSQRLVDDGDHIEAYLPAVRSAIAFLNRIHYFRIPDRLVDQIWMIRVLQDIAYSNSDTGGIQDIADWCLTSWLGILHDRPENVDVLRGSSHQL